MVRISKCYCRVLVKYEALIGQVYIKTLLLPRPLAPLPFNFYSSFRTQLSNDTFSEKPSVVPQVTSGFPITHLVFVLQSNTNRIG